MINCRLIAASTTRSPKAGRCGGSKRSCAPFCARRFYELRNRPDVPARVAVTEYVDVAAAFFGPEESGMINAVLDALARQTRPAEFASNR